MKMIKFIIFSVVVAAVASSVIESQPEHRPGYCKVGDHYIKEGEKGPSELGACMLVKCVSAEPGKEAMTGVGCGTFAPRPGCSTTDSDLTKLYPDCCQKEICPSDA